MGDLREALEEAYEEPEVEAAEEVSEEVQPEETVAESVDEAEQPAEEPKEAEISEPEAKDEPVQEGPKAPVDWDAGLRESWGSLPEAVRTKIDARERQMAQAMQGTAEARRAHQDLAQLSQTYGSVMAAEGATNPIQAVQSLLQTTTELRMGSPTQKATKMAALISHFGVDIGMLDNALVGTPNVSPEANHFEQLLEQKMAPVNQMMQQLAGLQQNSQQQSQLAVQQEMQEFQKGAEFLQDVRMDMADLFDMATRQGRELTLQDAYDKACMMNPQIGQIMQQRNEKQRLAEASQTLASKKNAASSVAGRGQGSTGDNAPSTLAGQLNQVWDDLAG